MRVALISDIHGHFVALDAVLADIARQDVDVTVCLLLILKDAPGGISNQADYAECAIVTWAGGALTI